MKAADRAILESFAGAVRQRVPEARIWAFGSRARGTAAADSDLDLLVVVPDATPEIRRAIRDIAWETGFARGLVLPTIILSAYEFESGPMSASSLVANVRREGVAA
ncbi:MAG: nucleotidyltransferase domain-containing protein [Gemmatimonadota bacterium]